MIKNLEFPNSKNETIQGILKERNTSGTLLICGNGLNRGKDDPATDRITNIVYEMGQSSFSFDFSKSAQGFALKEQVSDILDIVSYFSRYKKIVLFAPSLGSLSMVIAAQQLTKVNGLITMNGFFGSAQLGMRMLKVYLLFRLFVFFKKQYQKEWKYFKKNYQPQKIRGRVLVMHARYDTDVSLVQSKNFFQKLSGKKEFYLLEKADHQLTREADRQETAEVVYRWLQE